MAIRISIFGGLPGENIEVPQDARRECEKECVMSGAWQGHRRIEHPFEWDRMDAIAVRVVDGWAVKHDLAKQGHSGGVRPSDIEVHPKQIGVLARHAPDSE